MVQGVGRQCRSGKPEPDSAGCDKCPGCFPGKRSAYSHFDILRQNALGLNLRAVWSLDRPGIRVLMLIGLWAGEVWGWVQSLLGFIEASIIFSWNVPSFKQCRTIFTLTVVLRIEYFCFNYFSAYLNTFV